MIGSLGEAADPKDSSLVLYLPFDDDGGDVAKDHSQYGNDGDLNGPPKWVDGKFDGALQFDGAKDFVQVPHADILSVDEEVTVMAWINTERHGGPGNYQGIVAKSNGPRSYSLYIESGGGLHFSTAGVGTVSTTKVPLDEWLHVAAMVVDGTHKYYINGEPAGQGGAGIKLPGLSDKDDVLVGKTWEGTREFLGLIDEVRIWNRALDEDEVRKEMDIGISTAVNPSGKLGATWGSIKSMY
jgi:hypothetical protein